MTSLSATYYVSQRTGSDEMTDGRAVRRLPVCLPLIEEACSRETVSCWSGAVYFTDNICM